MISQFLYQTKLRLALRFLRLPTLRMQYSPFSFRDLYIDDICLPPLHGPKDHDDVTPLMSLIRCYNPRLVIEFGTAHGNTVANICRLCECEVVTVNALPEQMSGEWITFALSHEEIGRVYRKYGYEGRVKQVYENTLNLDLRRHVAPNSCDVGIVDACHDSEFVLNDFLKLAPFVREGGCILMHDTHPSMARHLGGSYTACMKLRLWGWNVCHIEGTWWAIWFKGGVMNSPAKDLLIQTDGGVPLWTYIRPMR